MKNIASAPKSKDEIFPYRVHTFALPAGASETINFSGRGFYIVSQSAGGVAYTVSLDDSMDDIPVSRGMFFRCSNFRKLVVKNPTGSNINLVRVIVSADPAFFMHFLDTLFVS